MSTQGHTSAMQMYQTVCDLEKENAQLKAQVQGLEAQYQCLENEVLTLSVTLEELGALYAVTKDQLRSDDFMEDAPEVGSLIFSLLDAGVGQWLIDAIIAAASEAADKELGAA
jgi:hypothetical protein